MNESTAVGPPGPVQRPASGVGDGTTMVDDPIEHTTDPFGATPVEAPPGPGIAGGPPPEGPAARGAPRPAAGRGARRSRGRRTLLVGGILALWTAALLGGAKLGQLTDDSGQQAPSEPGAPATGRPSGPETTAAGAGTTGASSTPQASTPAPTSATVPPTEPTTTTTGPEVNRSGPGSGGSSTTVTDRSGEGSGTTTTTSTTAPTTTESTAPPSTDQPATAGP